MRGIDAVRSALLTLLVLSAGPLTGGLALARDSGSPAPRLESLFTLSLEVEGDIDSYVEAEDPLDRGFRMSRDLVAQGEGRLTGQSLEGSFRWSLLGRKHPDRSFARVHLTGWLETEGGAEMFLRASGYAHDDEAAISPTTLFSMTGGFEVELEPEYDWLNGIVLLIEGRLDPDTRTFHYEAWVPSRVLRRRIHAETR